MQESHASGDCHHVHMHVGGVAANCYYYSCSANQIMVNQVENNLHHLVLQT